MSALTQYEAAELFKCINGRILDNNVFELLDGNALAVIAETSYGGLTKIRYEIWDEDDVKQYLSPKAE